MFLDRCCPDAKTAEQLDILSFSDIWPCHVGRQLFTHCPYWWSSNGPDYSIGMRLSPTNMWASHNSPQASCFVTHPRCWCEDDTVCAARENSIVVVPKVSYIFFHVPVQMFVLESAMLHFLTTIFFALPVCLFGLQSDTWPTLLAHSEYKTRPSILCVTHRMSRKKRDYSVDWPVPYEMMNYKWYLMVLGQYMTILAGTWSV